MPRALAVAAALAAGAAVLTVLLVLLAGALATRVLDPAAVERDVAAQFEQRHGVALELGCPERMEIAAGAVHRCTGTTPDGERVEIEIRPGGGPDGAYTWREV